MKIGNPQQESQSIFDQARPVVSLIEFCLLEKLVKPKNISEAFKDYQRQCLKEDLFVKYDKNKYVNLLLDKVPIKSLPDGKTVLS